MGPIRRHKRRRRPHASRRSCPVVGLVLCAMLALSCTVNPVSGRSEFVLMDEQDEQELGDRAAVQVEQEIGIVDDPELSAYVEQIGRELARYSPRQDVEYSFKIVDMSEPNAFALPGGYVYVSRGLLALANSEAEVANVIGHEIGHVAARHAAQRDTASKALTLLSLLGMIGAAAGGDGTAVAASSAFGPVAIAAYSRGQERQADAIAQELTSRAGIDPKGMATFLRALEDTTRLQTGASRIPTFLDTHPGTGERLAEATTNAETIRWQPRFSIAPTRAAYLAKLDGLVVGPSAREGVFHENYFLHADLGFALRFPRGWYLRNEHSRVMAIAPTRDAFTMLELEGPGDDPRAAAVAYARKNDLVFGETAPIRIGALRAFRARAKVRTPGGFADALLTWVAFDGFVYRLSAGAAGGSLGRYAGIFRSFARGFRPLRPEDLEFVK